VATRDVAEQFVQQPAAADADEVVRLHLYEDTWADSRAFQE
jgi:hypothetical protein